MRQGRRRATGRRRRALPSPGRASATATPGRTTKPASSTTNPSSRPRSSLKRPAEPVDAVVGREEALADGVDLGEEGERHRLEADDRHRRRVDQRVHVERAPADLDRSHHERGSEPQPDRRTGRSRGSGTATAGCRAAGTAGGASRRATCAGAAARCGRPGAARSAPRGCRSRAASALTTISLANSIPGVRRSRASIRSRRKARRPQWKSLTGMRKSSRPTHDSTGLPR